jgi:magnesium chelatase family protein
MNPCPCGQFGNPAKACRCTPDAVLRYQARISGRCATASTCRSRCPRSMPRRSRQHPTASRAAWFASGSSPPTRSRSDARARATPGSQATRSDRHCRLDASSSRFLQAATTRLGWSAQGFHRALRVARTIADLAASAEITTAHLGEAIQYRRGLATH